MITNKVFFMGSEDSMSARKKQWSKPQLIVLGRGKPEENVLAGCKTGNLLVRTVLVVRRLD